MNFVAPENYDRRAVGHESTVGASLKNCHELIAIKIAGISFKASGSGCPYLPREMRDMIFETATASLGRITPVVFGDVLLQASLLRMLRKACGLSRKLAPLAVDLPPILSRLSRSLRLKVMFHREAGVVLAVQYPGGYGNRAPRHDLRNENNSSSVIATVFAANIEAQVDLIEIGVKWNWETSEEPGSAESKAHEADVGSSVECIQRRAGRNVPSEQAGINLVIQHDQISPLSGKEYTF
ncbi:MAG: hypothetical protein WAN17_17300 [Candidatus Sulfotelmatobacter sp.]